MVFDFGYLRFCRPPQYFHPPRILIYILWMPSHHYEKAWAYVRRRDLLCPGNIGFRSFQYHAPILDPAPLLLHHDHGEPHAGLDRAIKPGRVQTPGILPQPGDAGVPTGSGGGELFLCSRSLVSCSILLCSGVYQPFACGFDEQDGVAVKWKNRGGLLLLTTQNKSMGPPRFELELRQICSWLRNYRNQKPQCRRIPL